MWVVPVHVNQQQSHKENNQTCGRGPGTATVRGRRGGGEGEESSAILEAH